MFSAFTSSDDFTIGSQRKPDLPLTAHSATLNRMKDAAAKSDAQVAPERGNSSSVSRSTYERDYYAWVQEQARALRERHPEALDWENLREEVEDLGKGVKSELRSRLEVILVHLLKWQYQPRKRSRSWEGSLDEQRLRAKDVLKENPSLQPQVPELTARAYQLACIVAGGEMGLSKREWQRTFPTECPWSVEQVLQEDFVPATARAASRPR